MSLSYKTIQRMSEAEPELMKQAKAAAALSDVSLRDWILEAIREKLHPAPKAQPDKEKPDQPKFI